MPALRFVNTSVSPAHGKRLLAENTACGRVTVINEGFIIVSLQPILSVTISSTLKVPTVVYKCVIGEVGLVADVPSPNVQL